MFPNFSCTLQTYLLKDAARCRDGAPVYGPVNWCTVEVLVVMPVAKPFIRVHAHTAAFELKQDQTTHLCYDP